MTAEVRREKSAVLSGVQFAIVDLAPDKKRAIFTIRVQVNAFATTELMVARANLNEASIYVAPQELQIEGGSGSETTTASP